MTPVALRFETRRDERGEMRERLAAYRHDAETLDAMRAELLAKPSFPGMDFLDAFELRMPMQRDRLTLDDVQA